MHSKKYIDPFSEKSKNISKQFDDATVNKNVEKLYSLIDQAKELAQTEDIASQAQIYYSIGTVYGDIASINQTSDEELIKKQLYYFRKSISLIQLSKLRIPEHPDSNSGNIRTRNRKYPDTLPAKLIVK
ncbi:hypothetical protein FRZ06_21100 [Anoxybacterium hadale]|uniref:Uncharacterized protein n=1 Tax=Anoxybacterium hadale TaxID=3408580 RepID=A0ACD1AGL6_9FIRM|nr:hypothetical protein FRZ06_21100 [Clostridiales bacterium]